MSFEKCGDSDWAMLRAAVQIVKIRVFCFAPSVCLVDSTLGSANLPEKARNETTFRLQARRPATNHGKEKNQCLVG